MVTLTEITIMNIQIKNKMQNNILWPCLFVKIYF